MRIGDLAGSVGKGPAALPEWGATEIAVDAFRASTRPADG